MRAMAAIFLPNPFKSGEPVPALFWRVESLRIAHKRPLGSCRLLEPLSAHSADANAVSAAFTMAREADVMPGPALQYRHS